MTIENSTRKPGWKVGENLILHRFDDSATYKATVELWSNSEFAQLVMEVHDKVKGHQRWSMRLDRAAIDAFKNPVPERNSFKRWVGNDIQSFTYAINHGRGGVAIDIVSDKGYGDLLARFELSSKKVALIISAIKRLSDQRDENLPVYEEMADVLFAAKAKSRADADKKTAAKAKKLEDERKAKELANVVTVETPVPAAAEASVEPANVVTS